MKAKLWCEARCGGIYDSEWKNDGTCRETSEGSFGAKQAAAAARLQGWREQDGEWICPGCLERRKEQ